MAQRFLSNIKVNDAYTLPASDGTDGQAITTDGAGNLSFTTLGDGEVVKIHCKNTSGASIAKGQPVYITGNVGNSDRLEVSAADASDSTKMPAVGLLAETLANDGEGDIVVTGFIKGIDTTTIEGSNGGSGDVLYVKPSGGLTYVKPTGTNLIQNIAKVGRDHSNGSLVVTSIMRTNDVPNIAEDYLWLGNSSSVATATEHLLNNVKDVTTSSPTDGQVLTWDNANSYWKNADASGGGGGSDTGTVTIERDVFDGSHATDPTDGNNTTFTISSVISGENNVQVYIDGVYQSKNNYTTTSDVVTFDPAPPANSELEIIHVKAITGQVTLDKFDGDNSTTAFTLSKSIDNENNLQVYINGVYQSKDNFLTSGSVLTFTTAPANNAKIEVVHIKAVDVTAVSADLFTGNGTQTAFDLTATPSGSGKTLVFVQGVYQEKSTYSISGNTLTFTTAPPDGYTIEVTTFGRLAVSENTVNVERFTGDSSTTDFSLSNLPSANNLDVYVSGLYQNKNSYTYSAGTISLSPAPDTGVIVEAKYIANITQVVAADNDFAKFKWDTNTKTAAFTALANRGYFVDTSSAAITVTLPSSPSAGDTFRAIDVLRSSSTYNITLGRNGEKINGLTTDYSININAKAVELVYTGSTRGWVIASDGAGPAPIADTIEYLVVAGGGGGGGYLGGGGGAGGFRAGTFTPSSGTQYTITVGPGGAGGGTGSSPTAAGKGTNSSIAATGMNTITATGGGFGGGYSGGAGGTGGSGGGPGVREGGSSGTAASSGNEGNFNPAEGFDSGTGNYRSSGAPYGPAASGGGATEAGGNGLNNTSTLVTGVTKGGDGKISDIAGSPGVIYAGGGGGNSYNGSVEVPGGQGGGGNGSAGPTTAGYDGTDGLGGGGGGGGGTTVGGGAGGDGVVILKIPTAYYTDTHAGSPTETEIGDYTIVKFTSTGSYTH